MKDNSDNKDLSMLLGEIEKQFMFKEWQNLDLILSQVQYSGDTSIDLTNTNKKMNSSYKTKT